MTAQERLVLMLAEGRNEKKRGREPWGRKDVSSIRTAMRFRYFCLRRRFYQDVKPTAEWYGFWRAMYER